MSAATATIVGGGLALAGGVASGIGASKAAGDQEEASNNATNAQMSMFDTTNGQEAGARATGYGAENQLSQLLGLGTSVNPVTGAVGSSGTTTPNYSGFTNNPGFQFATQLGQQAISRQAGAGGNLYSTSTLANLGNYTQGMASQNYNNYVNQLLQSAGLGQSANATTAGAATATGQGISNSITNAGQAAASGASAIGGSITGLANNNNFLNSITGALSSGGGGGYNPLGSGMQTSGAGNGGAGAQISYGPTSFIGSLG